MQTFADETLNYWADAFVGSGMARTGNTFEQFLAMSVPLRVRKLTMAAGADLQDRIELGVADLRLRGDHLVEPLHHQGFDSHVSMRLRRAVK